MPATIIGLSSLVFGGTEESVSVFTNFTQTSDSNKTVVVDENGDNIAAAYHGAKSVANLEGYVKGEELPEIGATVTLANAVADLGGVDGEFFCDSVSVTKVPNDFQKVAIVATDHGFATEVGGGGGE